MRTISVFCLIGLSFVLTSNAAVEWEKEFVPDTNTLFLAHFNNGFDADFAKGCPQVEKNGEIRQADGKFGKALTGFDKPQNYLRIAAESNVDFNCGTIEMWIKPNFDYDQTPEQYCYFFSCDAADAAKDAYKNCAYAFYDKHGRNFVFCWRANGKPAFANSTRQCFKKGEWIHLACSFGGEANVIAIMVNGKMGSTAEIPGKWKKNPGELIFGKGKDFDGAGRRLAQSDLDEVRIKNAFGYKIYEADKNFEVDGKKYFYCPRNKAADPQLPPVSFFSRILGALKLDPGFLIFRRDPRMVYPDSVPQKEELINEIKISATPGERKAVYFSLYALRGLQSVKIGALAPAEGGRALGMDKGIQIKKATFWPQKSGWTTRFYYIIPELLEQFDGGPVRKNESCTFWLDFKTSAAAKEGKYKGVITVENTGDSKSMDIPFEVSILPFKLVEPEGKYWLMFIDRYPEKSFDQQKEMLELFKDYGISGLLLNFAEATKFNFEIQNGKISGFQSDYLNDILKIYNMTGMKGPIALWFQFRLEQAVAKALEIKDPDFSEPWKSKVEAGLRQAVPLIDAFIKKQAPDVKWYFYGRDEPPPNSDIYRRTFWVYKILRDLGVNTCLSYYMNYKDEKEILEFIPLLKADISAGPALKDLKLLARFGCQFWYTGGGCYTSQEGGLMPNRFQAGFGFYQTGGEAHESWIWHRIKCDPFNEFKKNNHGENKNSMIAYPARNADSPGQYISTLQWEGIREGATDYKYIHTLNHYIALAKKNNLQQAAESAEEKLNAVLGKIPSVFSHEAENNFKIGDYYLNPGNFTDIAANECRNAIGEEIAKLVRLLNNENGK